MEPSPAKNPRRKRNQEDDFNNVDEKREFSARKYTEGRGTSRSSTDKKTNKHGKENTSSGGRGRKRKATDAPQNDESESSEHQPPKCVKTSETRNGSNSADEKPSTSGEENTNTGHRGRKRKTTDVPQNAPTPGSYLDKYNVVGMLGSGWSGDVYEATRKSDGFRVAIKIAPKYSSRMFVEGYDELVPLEPVFMIFLRKPPTCCNVIQMYEWFEEPEEVILVLEYPYPCVNLATFLKRKRGHRLSEKMARNFMVQLVNAVMYCFAEKGILHFSIKPENILINTETLQLKLIDFGFCILIFEHRRRTKRGAKRFCPRNLDEADRQIYSCMRCALDQVARVFVKMVTGEMPTDSLCTRPGVYPSLSTECRDLMKFMLIYKCDEWPSLEEVLEHEWFKQ